MKLVVLLLALPSVLGKSLVDRAMSALLHETPVTADEQRDYYELTSLLLDQAKKRQDLGHLRTILEDLQGQWEVAHGASEQEEPSPDLLLGAPESDPASRIAAGYQHSLAVLNQLNRLAKARFRRPQAFSFH